MSWDIVGKVEGLGTTWHIDYDYDFIETVALKLEISTEESFDSPKDALAFASKHIANVPWLAVTKSGRWIVDADLIRSAVASIGKKPLPDWFSGKQGADPSVSPTIVLSAETPGIEVRTTWYKNNPFQGLVDIVAHNNKKSDTGEQKDYSLSLARFHPEVARIATKYVQVGHYRVAVLETLIGLDNLVQNTAKLPETGAALMQKVFSQTKPLLKLSTHDEEQQGFMFLFTGAIKALRNQYGHKLSVEPSPNEAFEWLAFTSALFRLVDTAAKS